MSAVREDICPFCGGNANSWDVSNTSGYLGFNCHICKAFFISGTAAEKAKVLKGKPQILNCISENIRSNAPYGKEIVTSWHLESETSIPTIASNIVIKRLEATLDLPIVHASKPAEILTALAEKAGQTAPFDNVNLTLQDLYRLKIASFAEGAIWLKDLLEANLISSPELRTGLGMRQYIFANTDVEKYKIQITSDGWKKVYSSQNILNSKKVFIAMQFKWEDSLNEKKNKFIDAVKAGCKDCGYEADVVSQNHADQITDRIVSEIKAAKFVIADFTYNNQGAYYEAGLARGLGKKVIHTIMEGHTADPTDGFKRLHFDIKQINYLEWSNVDEVREKIKNRIKSVIEE